MTRNDVDILCLPGWACERVVDRWFGLPVTMLPHSIQAAALLSAEADHSWLPQGPWALVTWSQGTWCGLLLSKIWNRNPPRSWIALCPFLRLVDEELPTPTSRSAHRVLYKSFQHKPAETLDFFMNQHKAVLPWYEGPMDYGLMARTLELLGGDPPPHSGLIEVPLLAVLGDADPLVSAPMVSEFRKIFRHSRLEIASGLG
ncbi:MAG: hypothetical protein HQL31_02840, partial [Planctomycetes bacterium]|nr:hypothetical protein [Planctomycetota bacterium]